MTDVWVDEHDLETPDSVHVRFGITYLDAQPAEASVALRMPMEHFRNPFTGAPTLAPLAILVDAAAGVVNHYRRGRGQWTVSSELSMEFSLVDDGDLTGESSPPRTHRDRWARRRLASAHSRTAAA